MIQARRMMSFRQSWPCRALLVAALLYAIGGASARPSLDLSHLATGAGHALRLLAVGIAPVAAIAVVLAVERDRLSQRERRASVLGASLASLILLALLVS